MEIDVTTVIAQVFNFLLLVWLLRRFLYRPIINVIEARERAVKERVSEAEALQNKAKEEIDAYRAMQQTLEKEKEQYLQAARNEAERTLQNMLEQAAYDAEAAKHRFAAQLQEERREMKQSIQESIVKQICDVCEKVLVEISGKTVQDGMIDALEMEMKQIAVDALHDVSSPFNVRLSFLPDKKQKDRLRTMISDAFSVALEEEDVVFIVDESLVLGVEIDYGDSVIVWSAKRYLDSLEAKALERVNLANASHPQKGTDLGAEAHA